LEGETELPRPKQIVGSDPRVLSGTAIFVETRVPVKNLFDYLRESRTLDQFLYDFPSVSRDHALAALDVALEALTRLAHTPG
jgi:uncharacterized protein (DUF433 family)